MIKIITATTLHNLEDKANTWIVENSIKVINTSISIVHQSYNDQESYLLVITYN